jgi:hypothetical protein
LSLSHGTRKKKLDCKRKRFSVLLAGESSSAWELGTALGVLEGLLDGLFDSVGWEL